MSVPSPCAAGACSSFQISSARTNRIRASSHQSNSCSRVQNLVEERLRKLCWATQHISSEDFSHPFGHCFCSEGCGRIFSCRDHFSYSEDSFSRPTRAIIGYFLPSTSPFLLSSSLLISFYLPRFRYSQATHFAGRIRVL